jgi:hypothetical protein
MYPSELEQNIFFSSSSSSSVGAAVEIRATMVEATTVRVLMMTYYGIVPKKMKYFPSTP